MKIFKQNIRRLLGNKIRLSFMFIIPLLFIMLFLFGAFNTVTVGVVDNDQSELSKKLINDLKDKQFYNVVHVKEKDMLIDVLGFHIDYAIIIEPGFETELIENQELAIKDFYFLENENVMNAKIYLETYLSDLLVISRQSNKNSETFYQVLNNYESGSLTVFNHQNKTAKLDQAIASIGFTVYFLIFMSVITCGTILEDRKNGTLTRIFNSPISLKRYLFENLLSYILVGFLQVVIILSIFKFILKFDYNGGFFFVLLLLLAFMITSISMGLLVVSIVKSPIQAYLTIGIMASPLAMIGGCYWPFEMMPMWLQNIGKFLPTTWVMLGTKEIVVNQNTEGLIFNFLILFLFSTAFFVGGIFKKRDFAKA